jgi:hypothetical protein
MTDTLPDPTMTIPQLRAFLVSEDVPFNTFQLRDIAKRLKVQDVRLATRKAALVERILDKIGRPFDRAARDALHRAPRMLLEHPKGKNRLERRTRLVKTEGGYVRMPLTAAQRRWVRPAKDPKIPFTQRQIRDARIALARGER